MAQAIEEKVGDGIGHIAIARVRMRRHTDSPEHHHDRYVEIEGAEHACVGPFSKKRTDLVPEGAETASQYGAAALAKIAALPLDGPDGWRQATNAV
jgi:hypothetical protein